MKKVYPYFTNKMMALLLSICFLGLAGETYAQTYTISMVTPSWSGGCQGPQLFCNGNGFMSCYKIEAGKQPNNKTTK